MLYTPNSITSDTKYLLRLLQIFTNYVFFLELLKFLNILRGPAFFVEYWKSNLFPISFAVDLHYN